MISRLTCRHVSKLLKSRLVTHVRYIGFSYLSVSCAMGAVSDREKLPPAPEAATPSEKTAEHLTIHGQSVTTHAAQSEDIVKGETLTARNVQTIFGLQYLTPSLQVTPQFASGQPGYTIRGLGFNDYASNNAAAVGISINGVAQTFPFLTGGLMADIATVTIHRGPQGYEGGRSVSTGLIDYRTYRPEAVLAYGARFQYGRFGSMVVDGHASGQVAPRWLSRISFESRQGGAWQIGPSGADFGNSNQSVARLINRIQVHDALTLSLDVHGLYDRSDGMGLHRFTPLTTMKNKKRGACPPG
ncbi:MAG: TonB-dependent receptor plug domain-containing protein [Acetobacteraceae bacterium]